MTFDPYELGVALENAVRRIKAMGFARAEPVSQRQRIGCDIVKIEILLSGWRIGLVPEEVPQNQGMAIGKQGSSGK